MELVSVSAEGWAARPKGIAAGDGEMHAGLPLICGASQVDVGA